MPLLKVKLGGDGDAERIARGARRGAAQSRLIVDANEAWRRDEFRREHARLRRGRRRADRAAAAGRHGRAAARGGRVPCRSAPTRACTSRPTSTALAGKYDAINIKLDKAGGLTEALALERGGAGRGYRIMVGCMLGTSLAMAPALLVAQDAEFVDLDGPLLLARDREPGLVYSGAIVEPPSPALWG